MGRFLAIGECMVEMAPRPDGAFDMGFAGDAFNTAWYLHRCCGERIDVGFLSAIGDDDVSRRMEEFMCAAGVRPHLAVLPGRSVGLYLISLRDGERSFSYWRSVSAARDLADHLEEVTRLGPGDVAFFSGITLAILPDAGRERLLEALRLARAAGVRIAFDPNLRPRLWADGAKMCAAVMEGASVADIALPSFEDEASWFGDADTQATAQRYLGAGAGLVVVKDGASPVLLAEERRAEEVAVTPAEVIVDTTAAGDSFNARFLCGIMSGEPAAEAVGAASVLAAKVIAARGALVETA